jgi:hypothetical protein
VAQKPKKPKTGRKPGFDEKDAQILAILAVNPDATNEFIAKNVGLAISSVWERRQKYPQTDWFQKTMAGLRGLCADGVKAIRNKIGDDAYLAVKVFHGLGVLRTKWDMEHSGKIDIVRSLVALENMSADERRKAFEAAEQELKVDAGSGDVDKDVG